MLGVRDHPCRRRDRSVGAPRPPASAIAVRTRRARMRCRATARRTRRATAVRWSRCPPRFASRAPERLGIGGKHEQAAGGDEDSRKQRAMAGGRHRGRDRRAPADSAGLTGCCPTAGPRKQPIRAPAGRQFRGHRRRSRLLVAQRFDRQQPRRLARRVEAEEHADARGEANGEEDRLRRDVGAPVGEFADRERCRRRRAGCRARRRSSTA